MPIIGAPFDNQIWGVKRLNHISGLLKIIKRSIRPSQGIVISIR